jgi:hypothetical protein
MTFYLFFLYFVLVNTLSTTLDVGEEICFKFETRGYKILEIEYFISGYMEENTNMSVLIYLSIFLLAF